MVTTIDPQAETEVPTTPILQEKSVNRRNYWGVGPFRFRFNPQNFRPGRDFSLRRFSIAEGALLLIMGLLASRALGLVRQIIFNAIFGNGLQANAYYAAFRLPDILFTLIAGGTLVHAFVPIFVSYDKDSGKEEAWRLTSLVFNVMFVSLAALLLIAEFAAPTFVNRFLVPGYSPAEQTLTTTLTRIMLVQPLILGVGTIITAVLSSKRQFFLPALSIAIYNVGLIGGLLFTLAFPGIGIYGPTYGVLAAAACHVLVQLPGLMKQKFHYSFIWDLTHPGLHQVLRLLIPSFLAVGVISIAAIVDTAFTSYFKEKSSLAAIHNADLLFALAVALLGQVVSQAALPRMSLLAVDGHYVRLRQLAVRVIGGAVLLSIPTAILLVLLGKPLIHLLFQHGAFTQRSSSLVYIALAGYALTLPGHVASELLHRSFYSLKDARTPLFTNILGLGARVGLVVLLIRLLTGKYVLLAIPLAGGGAAAGEALLLCFLFFLRLRAKVKLDKGMQRLQQRRKSADLL